MSRRPAEQLPRCVICVVLVGLLLVSGMVAGQEDPESAPGDPERGRALVREAGCGNCHQIPDIALARGRVGPPLAKLARRGYLAGVLPNHYDNLVRWLTHTQEVAPGSAMPDLGLSESEAEDIATFLYTSD